ncbi:hydrogen peroxide-inducible genes activator [Paraferrimonas sp. SM1919]|uniref:hydrogen peroxide-inducible genes activator n=1 Tax=Paraferrimonas sp. SM1919 TaxID=2662263 RepID=UPI0013D5B0A6|nr:hydrogen peroxide-inducible genes activator [Paraferrimonas sp. SM1919]
MKHLPSIKNLHYLVQLYRQQNFNRAAKACNVSQSTLSTQIANLEEQLGQQLIERDNKSLFFTPLGEEVVAKAQEILLQVQDLNDYVKHHSKAMQGKVSIGCIPTIAPFLLSEVLALAAQYYPNLELQFKEDTTERLMQALTAGEVDIALLALPVDTGHFHTMALGYDKFTLVAHSKLAAQFSEPMDYSQLPRQSIYLLQAEHCITGHAISACKLEDETKINPFAATSLHTLVRLIESKAGATFLPEMAIKAGILANSDLIKIVPPGDYPYRQIGLAWRQTSLRNQTYRNLGEMISQLLISDLPQA